MTSEGAITMAYAVEDSFGELPDSPDWYGTVDASIDDFSIENNNTRKRYDDRPVPAGTREGNFLGSLTVSFDYADTNWHDIVLFDDGSLPTGLIEATTSTWYIEADLLEGNIPRVAPGVRTEGASISYTENEEVRITLSLEFGTETDDADSPTDAEIDYPDLEDVRTWHDTTLEINGTTVTELQSFEIDLSPLTRFKTNDTRFPHGVATVMAEPVLNVTAELEDADMLEYAWGGSGADTPQDTIDSRDATVAFGSGNGTQDEYDLKTLDPQNYSWDNLLAAGESTTDPTEFWFTEFEYNA